MKTKEVSDVVQRWGDKFQSTMDDIARIHLLLYQLSSQEVTDIMGNIQKRIDQDSGAIQKRPAGCKIVPLRRPGASAEPESRADDISGRFSYREKDQNLKIGAAERARQDIYGNLKVRGILGKIGVHPENVNVILAPRDLPDILSVFQGGNIAVMDQSSKCTICLNGDHALKMLLVEF